MAEPTKKPDQNPLQALVGGILGLPGQILEKTGLDQAGTMLVDSLQPDGTLSVSHLLDLGGIRSAKTRQREISTKIAELQLEGSQVQLDAAKRKAELDQINQALGMQQLTPQQQQVAAQVGGDAAERRVSGGAATDALKQLKAGESTQTAQAGLEGRLQAGAQAKADFLKRNALDAEAMAQRATARADLNSRLKMHGIENPEADTADLSLGQLQELNIDLVKDKLNERQLRRRQRIAARDRIKLAKERAQAKVYTPGKIGITFDQTIGRQVEDAIGIFGRTEAGKRVAIRSATPTEMAAMARAKMLARDVYQATKDTALANAVAVTAGLEAAGRTRFDLVPRSASGEFEFKGGWFGRGKQAKPGSEAPNDQGLSEERITALIERIQEHKLRNDMLLRSSIRTADGKNLGLTPGSSQYWTEWAKALDQIPGVSAKVVPDPLVPGSVKIDMPSNLQQLPKEQLQSIIAAILD